MESDEQERKLFVGGLNKNKTDEEDLKQFFQSFGNIIDCTIMRDSEKNSRGFGFVLFESSTSVDKIIASKKEGNSFVLDDHHIEVKRALPKVPGGNAGSSRTGGLYRKIFVGGLPSTISEDDLRNYFDRFGRVNEIELLRDRETNRLRGFAFITFDDEDSADKCIQRRSHEICKKICEVKRAQTRSVLQENEDRRRGGGGDYHHQHQNRHDDRHQQHPIMKNPGPANVIGASGLSMAEVNQLIQQAFVMGQQSVLQPSVFSDYSEEKYERYSEAVQPPTAASLLNLANAQAAYTPPAVNNTQLIQALLSQQSQAAAQAPQPTAPIAPIAPPQASAPAAPNSQAATLAQLARILQTGGIDQNALSSLLKTEPDNSRQQAPPVNKSSQNGAYSTAYPSSTAYDLYYGQASTNYGPVKDESDSSKRTYRPY